MKKENYSLLVQVLSLPFVLIGSVMLLLWEFLKCFLVSERYDLTSEELEQILEKSKSPKEQKTESKK